MAFTAYLENWLPLLCIPSCMRVSELWTMFSSQVKTSTCQYQINNLLLWNHFPFLLQPHSGHNVSFTMRCCVPMAAVSLHSIQEWVKEWRNVNHFATYTSKNPPCCHRRWQQLAWNFDRWSLFSKMISLYFHHWFWIIL